MTKKSSPPENGFYTNAVSNLGHKMRVCIDKNRLVYVARGDP